jgi:hypothetical protein
METNLKLYMVVWWFDFERWMARLAEREDGKGELLKTSITCVSFARRANNQSPITCKKR